VLRGFLGKDDVQIVAVCDVHAIKREETRKLVEKHYADKQRDSSYAGCTAYNDFRDVILRPGIDAVVIATPDHWHVPIAAAAARAGKDIYLEKPIGVSIAQAQVLRETVLRSTTFGHRVPQGL
jgi:predicted dehydrogenase